MNSYPPELLAQLAPVMFVAGLDIPKPQESTDSRSGPVPTSPGPQAQNPQQLDPFHVLCVRLRDALLSQRKPAIWAPEKNKTFQVVLVSPDVLFPPRKLVPPEDTAYSSSHSPLSPLTPTSPLYPDGLIAPIWIRKHTTLVPSVFVMFMRIFEFPHNVVRNPLDGTEGLEGERERVEEERRRDAELARDIANRKRGTSDRGVKLTVVLIASRRLLDDPALDSRLTFIRRQSGLDSRAALFVLSPVSSSELHDFVKSLQQALYDPALEYYTAHSKRVRRKRNRHSQVAASSYPNPAAASLANPNIARPLRPEGWTVRYEYKMACFAEFRGEDEVALKHYQDAYATLTIMFGSTAILPPRTKRWAEAKVLADCINIKIVKLYLYNNEHALGISHHNTHIRQFGDFSRGWGIGEETYEFWSWVARQYRVLAELIDQGARAGLTLPVHQPAPSSTLGASKAAGAGMIPELDGMARNAGINPSHALQHSGYYYYMAAKCTEARRARFLAALEAEGNGQPIAISPGFSNEKKVDHLALVLELYTKAYEQFKRNRPTPTSILTSSPQTAPSRLTLFIAYRIAEVHAESGKFDMAVKFFERIAKTYRSEGEGGWSALLKPLLEAWYKCAQRMGDVEGSVKLLIEMMGQDLAESEDPSALEEDLLAVFQSTVPSSTDEPLVFDPSGANSIFETDTVFWKDEVNVDEAAPFQLLITAPKRTVISSVPFTTVEVYFDHIPDPIVLRHDDTEEGNEVRKVTRLDLGVISLNADEHEGEARSKEVTANLRWSPGGTLVCTGALVSSEPRTLGIKKVIFSIESNDWKVKVPVQPHLPKVAAGSTSEPRWLRLVEPPQFIAVKRANRSTTTVKPRPHRFNVSIVHQEPALLDEDYPIVIEVVNVDDRELELIADVLLQPTDIDYAVNTISVNGDTSTGLIKDIPFGVLAPGVQATVTLRLLSAGSGGNRLLDVSISATSPQPREHIEISADGEEAPPEPVSPEREVHRTVYQETLTVPTMAPFALENDVAYSRTRGEWQGLADMATFEDDFFDQRKGTEALINLKLECAGPWGIHVDDIKLETPVAPELKLSDSSINLVEGGLFPAEYLTGDEFCMSCRADIGVKDDGKSDEYLFPSPGRYIITWRRVLGDGSFGATSTTIVPLPPLSPPGDTLVALFDMPATANLHAPVPLTVFIRNYHPTRSANITVQLEPDVSDGFVLAGLRSGRIPVLLPGAEEKFQWTLIPLECGYLNIPKIRILDRRRAIPASSGGEEASQDGHVGELVRIVDLRRDERRKEQVKVETAVEGGEETETRIVETGTNFGSVLVLPC